MVKVTVGVVGAGRALELHMYGYQHAKIPVRLKMLVGGKNVQRAEKARSDYGFEELSFDYHALLEDPEIDVIDICTPPYVHKDMIIEALDAGKHVICEKPLTGYFGQPGDQTPIGDHVSREKMFRVLLEELKEIQDAIDRSGRKFMYAENFIYAPAVLKAGEIIRAKKSKLLYVKGEESLKGSSSPVAGEWDKTGGGIFIRNGVHPLGAILWLKEQEAQARGEVITIRSVVGDMGYAVKNLTEYEHRHIAARPHDVEDSGTAVVTFSDGTKALIISTDDLLGGSKNYIELYCNDSAINCKLTMNDAMETYLLDEDGMEDVYLSEMLPSKTGWNKPFIGDEQLRGYFNEMQDFLSAVYYDHDPVSNFKVAADVIKVIYAAYLSHATGKRVDL